MDPQPQLQPQQLQPEQPAHSLAQSLLTNASGSAFSQMTLGQLIPVSALSESFTLKIETRSIDRLLFDLPDKSNWIWDGTVFCGNLRAESEHYQPH